MPGRRAVMARLGRLAMEALARQRQFSESQRRPVVEVVGLHAALEPRAVGRGVAGVDMLESAEGPMVVEVNASPGFEGLEETTGRNVARMFIEAAVRTARGRA